MEINSLLSGLVGALVYSLVQGYWMWKQIRSAEKTQSALIALMQEERKMLNTRFSQIASGVDNITTALKEGRGQLH